MHLQSIKLKYNQIVRLSGELVWRQLKLIQNSQLINPLIQRKTQQLVNLNNSILELIQSHSLEKSYYYSNLLTNILFFQMENSLPPIQEMYNCTRENRDYNVIRRYQDFTKPKQMKKTATKKGHYLDLAVRMNTSPGPANNSNLQSVWAPKNAHQPKYSNRTTYIDQVQRLSKKQNSPSPDKYAYSIEWSKKSDQIKHVSQKTNFVDTSQYYSDKTPGPGTYLISTKLSKQPKQGKHVPNFPLKPRENDKADMNTYSPCPADYNTFMKYSMSPKAKGIIDKKSPQKKQEKGMKQNVPGPGAYQMINSWKGKEPLKKNQLSYMQSLSKGPIANRSVYY